MGDIEFSHLQQVLYFVSILLIYLYILPLIQTEQLEIIRRWEVDNRGRDQDSNLGCCTLGCQLYPVSLITAVSLFIVRSFSFWRSFWRHLDTFCVHHVMKHESRLQPLNKWHFLPRFVMLIQTGKVSLPCFVSPPTRVCRVNANPVFLSEPSGC